MNGIMIDKVDINFSIDNISNCKIERVMNCFSETLVWLDVNALFWEAFYLSFRSMEMTVWNKFVSEIQSALFLIWLEFALKDQIKNKPALV